MRRNNRKRCIPNFSWNWWLEVIWGCVQTSALYQDQTWSSRPRTRYKRLVKKKTQKTSAPQRLVLVGAGMVQRCVSTLRHALQDHLSRRKDEEWEKLKKENYELGLSFDDISNRFNSTNFHPIERFFFCNFFVEKLSTSSTNLSKNRKNFPDLIYGFAEHASF